MTEPRVIEMRGRGARGESQADILRRTGQFGVLPTDTDPQVMAKLVAAAITTATDAINDETAARQAAIELVQQAINDTQEADELRDQQSKDRDATKLALDGSDTMGGPLDMGDNRMVNVAAPVAGTDAATKNYANIRSLGRPAPIATFGDSRSYENGPTPNMLYNTGYAPWAEIFTGGRVTFPTSLCFGVGGNTTSHMLARVQTVITAMQAAGSEIVVFLGGVNDVAIGGLTATQTLENIAQIYAAFYKAGIKMIIINELPRNDGVVTGDGMQRRLQVRAYVQDVFSTFPGVYIAEPSQYMTDITATNFMALTGFLRTDGLHCSVRGGLIVGREVAEKINLLVAHRPRLAITGVDVYTTTALRGNLLVNAMLQGSGAPSGGTGVKADNWDALVDNGAGLTVVWSIVTIGNYRWQQIRITGTPTASDPRVRFQNSLPVGYISAGDVLAGNVGVQLDAGATGLRGIMLQMIINNTVVGASPATQVNGLVMGPEPILVTSDGHMPTLCAPAVTVPNGTLTNAVMSLNVALQQGTAVDVTVRFGQPALRKV
jgi:lysophospholipase L1-like esterase